MIHLPFNTRRLFLSLSLGLFLLSNCLFVPPIVAKPSTVSPARHPGLGPSLVPDRPGYADSTSSVDHGHWHFELGGVWLPEEEASMVGLLRYGLRYGWELRLMTPTLTHTFPYETIDGSEVTPDLAAGGTQFGAKWSKHWYRVQWSVVSMVGLPVAGVENAFTPDPLVSLGSQISHNMNDRLSVGLAMKYALHDGWIYGQDVAYGEELTHLFGLVGALTWSDVGYSLFTQAGAELYGEVVTPLVGGGTTLRITHGSQVDFSIDAPLSSAGVTLRYMAGLTLSW